MLPPRPVPSRPSVAAGGRILGKVGGDEAIAAVEIECPAACVVLANDLDVEAQPTLVLGSYTAIPRVERGEGCSATAARRSVPVALDKPVGLVHISRSSGGQEGTEGHLDHTPLLFLKSISDRCEATAANSTRSAIAA